MGIMDLVAYNFEDYVKLANKCATNKLWRNEISEKIKDNIHLIFNEVDSINAWINFCIDAVNNNYSENPIVVPNTNKFNNDIFIDISKLEKFLLADEIYLSI